MTRKLMRPISAVGFIFAMLVTACAGPVDRSATSGPAGAAPPKAKTTLNIAVLSQPRTVSVALNGAGGTGAGPGADTGERLMNAGLTVVDKAGARFPLLAAQVPTIENGLWRVSADGAMDVTWKLRTDARWHDGTLFTANDVLMAWKLEQDRDIIFFKGPGTDYVDRVVVVDPQTVQVHFKSTYIDADAMFKNVWPSHLLADAYASDPSKIIVMPYWTKDFVGIGPYKLKEWQEGVSFSATAYDGYVRGRPKIDDMVVKFIPEATTLYANVLAGGVDLTTTNAIGFAQSIDLKAAWPEGTVGYQVTGTIILFPQHLNPDPIALTDVRFRRALFHALDRREMDDVLEGGTVPVADIAIASPGDAEYRHIEQSIVKYAYDPRRAMQLIEEAGLRKGTDGKYRQPDGRMASIEIQATTSDINSKSMAMSADYWRKVGLDAVEAPTPRAREQDYPYRWGRPGFTISRAGTGFDTLHSKEIPTPETNWTGDNKARYLNPELDVLIDRYKTTLAFEPRMDIYRQAARIVSDQLALMPLVHTAQAYAYARKLVNMDPAVPAITNLFWNIEEWVVQ